MKLAAYPEYKDSGQPFLGRIPAHWEVLRNGRLFAQRNETGYGGLPILEVSLKTGVRVRDMDNLKRKQMMSDHEKYKRAALGDIAYNMMRLWQGAVGIAPVDGLVSPAYVVVRPFPEVDCRFFTYLFRTDAYKNEVDAYSRGIVKDRNRLYWQDFKRMPSVVPPLEEQRQIAGFLDRKTAQFNRFIRNKRRLIELLKEQKQNVINQAVTRGLDPNIKLKPSGVEWIGDIPEHWELRRLKSLSRINSGQVNPQDKKYEAMTLIAPNHIEAQSGSIAFTQTCAEQGAISTKYFAKKGQLLYSKIRPALRKATIAPSDCLCSADMYGISFDNSLISIDYALLTFLSNYFTKYATDCSMRVAMPKINREALGVAWIALPSLAEQSHIIDYVAEETSLIDYAISRAQRENDLIREYRARLISDVVTGQVDVRQIAVPEIAEQDLTPLDEDDTHAEDLLDEALETEDEA